MERLLKNRKAPQLSPAELHEWLVYDPDTGLLRWRKVNNWSLRVGDVVGSLNDQGYVKFKIEGVSYGASRAIWAMQTGAWPDRLVDHKDGVRSNNTWTNLRLSTNSQNCRNGKTRRRGLKGATWSKAGNRWAAQIGLPGHVNKHLGLFDTEEEAHEAYKLAAAQHYQEFARFS